MELVPDGTEEFILDDIVWLLEPNPDYIGPGMLVKLRSDVTEEIYFKSFIRDGKESYLKIVPYGVVGSSLGLARYDGKPTSNPNNGGQPWTHKLTDKDYLDYYISQGKTGLTRRSRSRLELIDQ